jgi:hypothetical protein
MSQLAPLLFPLICVAIMFGAGALAWLATRTPLKRVPWIARRADTEQRAPQSEA